MKNSWKSSLKIRSVLCSGTALFLASVLLACATSSGQKTAAAPRMTQTPFGELLHRHTEAIKRLDAFAAPYFNIEADLDKFGDYPSPAYFERAKTLLKKTKTELEQISETSVIGQEKVTYQLLKEDLILGLKDFEYPSEFYDFNQMSNRLLSFLDESNPALTSFPFDSVPHYEAFIRKASGLEFYVNAQTTLLRTAIKRKIILPCELAHAAPLTFQEAIDTPAEKHPFLRPVQNFPASISTADKERLTALYLKTVKEIIVPQYQKFGEFYRKEYLPACKQSPGFGIGRFLKGKGWYQHSIQKTTSLNLTPEMIHKTGLSEVARIRTEMIQIQKTLQFSGSYKEFLKFTTTDQKFFFKDAASMLQSFRDIRGKIEQQIPMYFDLIPKTDYKLVESSNPEDAAARYMDPTDLQPFGRFVLNTKNLKSTPTFGVTTLSLHEAIPGHHFQMALQFELKDQLPEYRRKLYFSGAFVEGWALYAEFLGREMGLFTDPLQKLGHLSDEMLRAVRLVVDTGIHHYGWSQKKARDYMEANLAADPKDIHNEVNRYAAWPGQAVGYKVGQIKILELRKLAEKELGSRFQIQQFHRQVIGSGTLSLAVLENQVKQWITSQKTQP